MKNTKVYFIEGGFQRAQQDYEQTGKVEVRHGEHPHATDCLSEGTEGQLFFTGLAWSQSKESMTREIVAYTGCDGETEIWFEQN